MKQKTTPRGIRNNNPLNIRKTDTFWNGQIREGKDKSFVEFKTPIWGFRAAARILMSYSRRGINTMERIVTTWAPHSENPTKAYVQYVSRETGLKPNDKVLTVDNKVKLLKAMAKFENAGEFPYTDSQIEEGIRLA